MEVTRKQKLLELKQEFAALHEDAEGKLVGGFATIYSNMASMAGSNSGCKNYECDNYHCNNSECDNTDCTNSSCNNSGCVSSTPTEKPLPSPSPTQTGPTFTPPVINIIC